MIPGKGKLTIHDVFQDIIAEDGFKKETYLSKLAKVSHGFDVFFMNNPAKAIFIYQQGLQDSVNQMDRRGIMRFSATLGDIYRFLGKYPQALKYGKKALEICEKTSGENHPDIARYCDNVGSSLRYLSRYKEALQHHQKALKIFAKLLEEDRLDKGEKLQ